MRIGINCLGMLGDRADGGATFTRNLVYGLEEFDKSNDYFIFVDKSVRKTFSDIENDRFSIIPVETDVPKSVLIRRLRKALHITKIRMSPNLSHQAEKYKIHMMFHTGLMDLTLDIPGIACIYDIQHEYYPALFPVSGKWRKETYREYADKAFHVVTVSNYSKKTILEKYDIGSEKVSVVYTAVSPQFQRLPIELQNEVRDRYNLPIRFLLYPATFLPHKNHVFLLEGFAMLKKKLKSELGLVFTGNTFKDDPQSSYLEIVRNINELNLNDDVLILERLPDCDMPAIYNLALLMVTPSLFEGFGIPIIEAMACGCPVVCSNVTSLPEIAKDAAMYFDPNEKDSMIDAMLAILTGKNLRNKLIRLGFERAKQFSRREFAIRMRGVFEGTFKNFNKNLGS